MKKLILALLVTLFGLTMTWGDTNTVVEPTEKFEWGAGLLSVRGNHYRGSDQAKNWIIPTPYFTYTSEVLEVEPSFARGTFYKNDWLALKMSVIVGLNVESEKNKARAGMDSLDYMFELGPMAIVKIWESETKGHSLTFEMPFRMVNSTDLTNAHNRGFFSISYINWRAAPHPSRWNWGFELSAGAMWGSRKYHEYFYGVAPWFETPERSAYKATSGFSGTQITLILNKRWKDLIFVPFLRYDNLVGTAFEDSPLVKQRSYLVGGLGFFWLFGNKL